MSKVYKKRTLPNNWNWKKISDFANTASGGTPKSTNKAYYERGTIPWINSGELNSPYINTTQNFITEEGLKNSSAKIFPVNSVLVALYGATAGKASLLRIEATTNQAICAILPNKNYDSKFLKYNIDTLYSYLIKISTGSARDNLSQDIIKDLQIGFPDLKQQQRIASVLSSLDDKIELNSRINTELEAMTKTVYDYWFVQFDFPDANGKPYKSSGGKMVYNKELKREIPEGWEVGKIADWIGSNKSGDWGKEQKEGNYKLKVSCFRGADINGLNGKGELNPPERYILEKNRSKTLNPYDLIIEISGGSPTQSTGRMAYITPDTLVRFENPLICSNFCKAISLKNYKYLYNYAFLWNMLYDNNVFFGFEGKTSGIKNFLFDSFVNSYWSVIPNEKIVLEFFELMQKTEQKKQKLLAENQQLASLRDWLLPMLMNGQVGFKEKYHEQSQVVSMAAENGVEYKLPTQQDKRFELWLSNQGLAARGDIDKSTLREIFNIMDEEEYGK